MEYKHTPDMGEISGMGSSYEETCQNMLNAGVQWLNDHRDASIEGRTIKNVYGIFDPTSNDAKELSEVIVATSNNECTGAMHQAVMQRLIFVAKNGWDKYCEELRNSEKGEAE